MHLAGTRAPDRHGGYWQSLGLSWGRAGTSFLCGEGERGQPGSFLVSLMQNYTTVRVIKGILETFWGAWSASGFPTL